MNLWVVGEGDEVCDLRKAKIAGVLPVRLSVMVGVVVVPGKPNCNVAGI